MIHETQKSCTLYLSSFILIALDHTKYFFVSLFIDIMFVRMFGSMIFVLDGRKIILSDMNIGHLGEFLIFHGKWTLSNTASFYRLIHSFLLVSCRQRCLNFICGPTSNLYTMKLFTDERSHLTPPVSLYQQLLV